MLAMSIDAQQHEIVEQAYQDGMKLLDQLTSRWSTSVGDQSDKVMDEILSLDESLDELRSQLGITYN